MQKALVEKGDFIGEMWFSFGEIFFVANGGLGKYANNFVKT
jgi:hypothetical protein